MALLLSAARRFLLILVALGTLSIVVSLPLGLLLGASVSRSISLGFYIVGCFLLVAGFAIGNKGPLRFKRGEGSREEAFWGARVVRWATEAEREDAINTSAVFVVGGLVLVIVGVLADDRFSLI